MSDWKHAAAQEGTRRPSSFRLTPISFELVAEQFARTDRRQFLSLRHNSLPSSVVIHDFDIVCVPFAPGKADAPAIIDPNAMLTTKGTPALPDVRAVWSSYGN